MKKPRFNSIAGVEGAEHIYAVLSLGKKDANLIPREKDRFHIVNPHETDKRRLTHEDYEPFNAAPKELRTTIRGNIMHATKQDCFGMQLFNYTNKAVGTHPKELPFCEGDGTRARRWMGKTPDNFDDIKCTNRQCPFAISKECRSMMRFYFRIRWTPVDSQKPIDARFATLPTTMFKYVSKGWNMVNNFMGFFEDIDRMAKGLGLQTYSLVGLPFVMRVYDRTGKVNGQGVRYPVVSISAETDILSFFRMQKEMISYITAGQTPVGLLSDGEQKPDVIAADWRSVTVVDVPAKYEDPEENKKKLEPKQEEPIPEHDKTEKVSSRAFHEATDGKKEPVSEIEPERKQAKKYEPMPLDKLAELTRLETIPDEKLPYLIYDTFAHYAERSGMSKPEAYKLLFGSEDGEGKVSVLEWDKAKKDIATLRKFDGKARRAVLNMAKEKK